MTDTTQELLEDRIRQRAYRLWREDGSPEGRANEYWHRAEKQIAAEGVDMPADEAYPEPTVEQSDKQHLEAPVPEDLPDDQGTVVSQPRAKRRRA